jgi:hypothetical protein
LLALARMALGSTRPATCWSGRWIGVTIPLLAFRWFAPGEVFPVSYHRGRSAHLDVGGARGQAIRRAGPVRRPADAVAILAAIAGWNLCTYALVLMSVCYLWWRRQSRASSTSHTPSTVPPGNP